MGEFAYDLVGYPGGISAAVCGEVTASFREMHQGHFGVRTDYTYTDEAQRDRIYT